MTARIPRWMDRLRRRSRAGRVVIVTHRDLMALAPQPVYLARALAARGVDVVIVSRAPRERCAALREEGIAVIGAPRWAPGQRGRLAALYLRAIVALLRARVGIAFDIDVVWPLAIAHRVRRLAPVLYWLEPFYGDYVVERAPTTLSMRLGLRALESLSPPAAMVDVHQERLKHSAPRCGHPAATFVVPNAPPLASGWNGGPPQARDGAPRLVYAGSVTGLGVEGIELLLRALQRDGGRSTLTILPAEGRRYADEVAQRIRDLGLDQRVELRDRVPRETLPTVLREFDVGVVLYPVRAGQNINSTLAAPNKLYEYLASGLAVIASDNATIRFVEDEGLGWLVPGSDPTVLADVLTRASVRREVDERRMRAHAAFVSRHHFEAGAVPLVEWISERAGVAGVAPAAHRDSAAAGAALA